MEDKKKIKISLKLAIFLVIVAIVIIGGIAYLVINNSNNKTTQPIKEDEPKEEKVLYNRYTCVDKPIIYLYPTEDTEVTIKLLKSEYLTSSYPKYENEWKVLAKPNGNLTDLRTDRRLYSLYYECMSSVNFKVKEDGFVVKGEEVAEFLEEKLEILGLTEREAEECIVYWLPELEANNSNYIRFATYDEINENMPLEINPQPDTIIRVLMIIKGLENPIDVTEQKLETPARTGFTVVEWGGAEIE